MKTKKEEMDRNIAFIAMHPANTYKGIMRTVEDMFNLLTKDEFEDFIDISLANDCYNNYLNKKEMAKRFSRDVEWAHTGRPLATYEVEYQSSVMYSDYGNKSMGYTSFNPFANTISDDIDAAYKEKEENDKREKRIKEIAIQAALEGVDINIIASFKEEYLQLCEYAEFDDIYYQTIVAAEGRNGRLDPRTDYESYHRYKVDMQNELDAWADDNMSIIPYSETNVNPQDWSEFWGVFFETK